MRLQIHFDDKLLRTIADCPGEYDDVYIYLTEGRPSFVKRVKKHSTGVEELNEGITEQYASQYIHTFMTDPKQELPMQLWTVFNRYLGFVPFWEYSSAGVCKYMDTPASKLSIEEIRKLKKPVVYESLLGIQVPSAILNRMQTVADLKATMGELPQDIENFPHSPHLTEYIKPALAKIASMQIVKYTLTDMAVFDFLGVLSIFREKQWFVNGDELIEFNSVNLLNHGHIEGTIALLFTFRYSNATIEHDDPLLTDSIIEVMQVYKKVEQIYETYGKFALRAMKTFLKNRKYT